MVRLARRTSRSPVGPRRQRGVLWLVPSSYGLPGSTTSKPMSTGWAMMIGGRVWARLGRYLRCRPVPATFGCSPPVPERTVRRTAPTESGISATRSFLHLEDPNFLMRFASWRCTLTP